MTPELTTLSLADIQFDEGLYPRVDGHDPSIVQEYARDMEQVEAAGKHIAVNADNVLVDGRHRMLAYKKRADGRMDGQKLPMEMRYSAPYESQQCTAQMVEWAKAAKRSLVPTREIVVWRVE